MSIKLIKTQDHFRQSIQKSSEILNIKIDNMSSAYLEALLVQFLKAENSQNFEADDFLLGSVDFLLHSKIPQDEKVNWLKKNADLHLYTCGLFILCLDKKITGSSLRRNLGKLFYKKLSETLDDGGDIYSKLSSDFDSYVEILNYITYCQMESIDKQSLYQIYNRYKMCNSPAAERVLLDFEIDLNFLEKKYKSS